MPPLPDSPIGSHRTRSPSRRDVPGSGVSFTFLELAGQSTGWKDDYPVDGVYGQILPSDANGDFSFTIYREFGKLPRNIGKLLFIFWSNENKLEGL